MVINGYLMFITIIQVTNKVYVIPPKNVEVLWR